MNVTPEPIVRLLVTGSIVVATLLLTAAVATIIYAIYCYLREDSPWP